MVEDLMPMPCLAERVGAEYIPEPFAGKCLNAVYHCNGGVKTYVRSPVCFDGIAYSNGNSNTSLKRSRLESSCTYLSDERVLSLVASHTNWDPSFLCSLSCVCKKTRAISDRHLWREFCHSRAPRMVSDLLLGAKNKQIDGDWRALGKLFLYCAGCCESGSSFPMQAVAGHFMQKTRFSRTSGRFFLLPGCRNDVLYMSDPCEHANGQEDVGLFRGVFRSFDKSKTKKLLALKRAPISEEEKCPYCKAGVWNMKRAKMIPKSASTRLAAYNENIEFSLCLNGHVNGKCALLRLSDSENSDEDE